MPYTREQLEGIFNVLDTNGDGILEFNELKQVLINKLGIKEDEAHKICLVSFPLLYIDK